MASITINSENVIQACNKTLEEISKEVAERDNRPNRSGVGLISYIGIKSRSDVLHIKNLAEFSNKFEMSISINQDDFTLIGEYITFPELK